MRHIGIDEVVRRVAALCAVAMRTVTSSRRVPVYDEGTAIIQTPLGKVKADSMHSRRCWSEWARAASRFDLISVASHSDWIEGLFWKGKRVLSH